jgi:hypothetical protein
MAQKSTYYKDSLPDLMAKYKIVKDQCLLIISQDIDEDISDDKLYNVLKSKRMASEDYKYYAKEIENLENEMNNVHVKEEKKPSGAESFTVEK